MTVLPTSYEANVSAALVQALADAATFQATASAANATMAKAAIVEDDAGDSLKAVDGSNLDITRFWGLVRMGPTNRVDRAARTWGYEGTATIALIFWPDATDTPSEAIRRARNVGGAIASELQAQIGGAARLCYATFEIGEIAVCDEVGPEQGALIIPIAVTWRDLP